MSENGEQLPQVTLLACNFFCSKEENCLDFKRWCHTDVFDIVTWLSFSNTQNALKWDLILKKLIDLKKLASKTFEQLRQKKTWISLTSQLLSPLYQYHQNKTACKQWFTETDIATNCEKDLLSFYNFPILIKLNS